MALVGLRYSSPVTNTEGPEVAFSGALLESRQASLALQLNVAAPSVAISGAIREYHRTRSGMNWGFSQQLGKDPDQAAMSSASLNSSNAQFATRPSCENMSSPS